MIKKFHISLGPNCHSAFHLVKLKIRSQSLPFDWLLCSDKMGIYYVNKCIETNFSDYLLNLSNIDNFTISNNYPFVKFIHSNPLDKGDYDTLTDRAERFMNIINDKTNFCFFYFGCSKDAFETNFDTIKNDIINFISLMESKCSYLLVFYVTHDKKFNFDNYWLFDNVLVLKYVKNINKARDFGNHKDFINLIMTVNKMVRDKNLQNDNI